MTWVETVVLWLVALYAIYRVVDRLLRVPRVGGLGNRYVFVTGSDTGFGNATCKKLDRLGCNVFAGCLTEKGETELTKTCSNRLKPVRLDVTNHNSVVKAYETVKSCLPKDAGLWGLLNNAGISGKIGPTEWLTRADYDDVMNVNLYGLIDVTNTFLPLLKKARGRIVNTASIFGRFSLTGSAPYCVSKFGVECYSDGLRREMKWFGVTVHLIEPGFHRTHITDTDCLKRALLASWDQISDEKKAEYGREFVDQGIEQIIKNFLSGIVSPDITPVVNGYTHALTASFPRARYVIGKDAKMVWLPLTYLPEWLTDWLLEIMAKDRPVPAACKQK